MGSDYQCVTRLHTGCYFGSVGDMKPHIDTLEPPTELLDLTASYATIAEAAELLGIAYQAAGARARRGYLPSITLGRTVLIPRSALPEPASA